jgi:phosphoglycolate phosphatase-like HAD superfamily hydrolase
MAEPHATVEAIFFDFDGVLVDSVAIKRRAFEEVIAPLAGPMLPECMAFFMTQGGVSRLLKFRHVWSEILKKNPCEESAQRLAEEFALRVFERTCSARPIPGANEFLDRYARTIPCYVISGTPEKELRAIIDRRSMTSYFRGAFGSPASKVEIGRQLLQAERLSPERVSFVGDATTDRDAARQLAVRFIGLHGPHLSPYLDGSEEMIDDLCSLDQVLWNVSAPAPLPT